MVVSRRFSYRGQVHSYLSASCPLPPHFTSGFLSAGSRNIPNSPKGRNSG